MEGQALSHYQVLERLGAGGMGVVYRARDTRLARYVALKVLRPGTTADRQRKDRLTQEARSASALNHPNIITIYDIDAANGVDFIAMEYVEGKSLASLIAAGRLLPDAALKYAVQMASALAAASSWERRLTCHLSRHRGTPLMLVRMCSRLAPCSTRCWQVADPSRVIRTRQWSQVSAASNPLRCGRCETMSRRTSNGSCFAVSKRIRLRDTSLGPIS